jgi:hypothetical protein
MTMGSWWVGKLPMLYSNHDNETHTLDYGAMCIKISFWNYSTHFSAGAQKLSLLSKCHIIFHDNCYQWISRYHLHKRFWDKLTQKFWRVQSSGFNPSILLYTFLYFQHQRVRKVRNHLLVSSLVYFLTLKIESIYFSEMPDSLQATWLYNPENCSLHRHRCENLNSNREILDLFLNCGLFLCTMPILCPNLSN